MEDYVLKLEIELATKPLIEQIEKQHQELKKLNVATTSLFREVVEREKENTKLKEVLKVILKDGKPSENNISFEVMTGRHYYDMINNVIWKQNA